MMKHTIHDDDERKDTVEGQSLQDGRGNKKGSNHGRTRELHRTDELEGREGKIKATFLSGDLLLDNHEVPQENSDHGCSSFKKRI